MWALKGLNKARCLKESKMKYNVDNLALTTTNFSGSATSAGVDIKQVAALAIQVEISPIAGLSGTLKLQGTNVLDASWTDIAGQSLSLTTVSATYNALFNVDTPAYLSVRLSWTWSAGTGTCSVANISTKAV